MAELILTKEEENVETLLDWSDETLGKAVRQCAAFFLENDATEEESLFAVSCAHILCAAAAGANADDLTIDLEGVSYDGQTLGNWQVHIKRIATTEMEK